LLLVVVLGEDLGPGRGGGGGGGKGEEEGEEEVKETAHGLFVGLLDSACARRKRGEE